jgi:hypothetical protein
MSLTWCVDVEVAGVRFWSSAKEMGGAQRYSENVAGQSGEREGESALSIAQWADVLCARPRKDCAACETASAGGQ